MEKWWVTHLQTLRIWSSPAKGSKWVWKEANLIILLGRMRKLGQMKRVRMREKPMLWLPFLYGQVSHQPNNVITQPFSLPTAHLSTKAIPKSTTKPTYHTTNAKHHLWHKPKHQPRNEFCSEKPVGFTPKFWCHMLTCSHIYSTIQWLP